MRNLRLKVTSCLTWRHAAGLVNTRGKERFFLTGDWGIRLLAHFTAWRLALSQILRNLSLCHLSFLPVHHFYYFSYARFHFSLLGGLFPSSRLFSCCFQPFHLLRLSSFISLYPFFFPHSFFVYLLHFLSFLLKLYICDYFCSDFSHSFLRFTSFILFTFTFSPYFFFSSLP